MRITDFKTLFKNICYLRILNISEEDDPLTFLTKPTTDTIGAYEWNDESAYVYEIHAFDSDWPWQGYPVLELTTPLPSWAKWQTLGNGKAYYPVFQPDDAGCIISK